MQLLDVYLKFLDAEELVYYSLHRLGGVDGPSGSSDPKLPPVHIDRLLAGEEVVVDDGGERSANLPRRLEGGYAEPTKNLLDQLLWEGGLYVSMVSPWFVCFHVHADKVGEHRVTHSATVRSDSQLAVSRAFYERSCGLSAGRSRDVRPH